MNEDKERKTYELALLVKSEDDAARAAELVKQHNGENVSEPRMKKLAFTYKIKGNTEGVFASVLFTASGEDAKDLEVDLRTRPNVIRSMVLKAPPQSERQAVPPPPFHEMRGRSSFIRPMPARESKPAAPAPLTNDALENLLKKI